MASGLDAVDAGRDRVLERAALPAPTVMYLLRQLELAVRSRLDDILRPTGLTGVQYTTLTTLEGAPDLTSAQLARNFFVTAQSISDTVTVLEDRGLVVRSRDATDRRRLVLHLTPDGRGLLSRFRDPVADLELQMLDGLSSTQVQVLRHCLLRCSAELFRDVVP